MSAHGSFDPPRAVDTGRYLAAYEGKGVIVGIRPEHSYVVDVELSRAFSSAVHCAA